MARDEYHGYVPQFFGLLKKGSPAEKNAAFLTAIETDRMGLQAGLEKAAEVADVLLEWEEVFSEKRR
jgi:hypothetical protein